MTSYQFAEQHNLQTVLWTIGGATWTAANLIRALLLLPLLSLLAKALIIGAALAAAFAVVVAFWLPICQVVGGLAIVAVFGWATFPKVKAVK